MTLVLPLEWRGYGLNVFVGDQYQYCTPDRFFALKSLKLHMSAVQVIFLLQIL